MEKMRAVAETSKSGVESSFVVLLSGSAIATCDITRKNRVT